MSRIKEMRHVRQVVRVSVLRYFRRARTMNIGVLFIIVVAVVLIAFLVLPKLKGVARAEKTTVERRSGKDRRQRNVRVPVERRKKDRRAEDAAKTFVKELAD